MRKVMQNTRCVHAALALLALASACGSARGPGGPAPVGDTTVFAERRASLADVGFMQGMIAHHAQALAITRLVPTRTTATDLRLLAERIAVSQRDEIRLMSDWLRARSQPVPDTTHLAMGHVDPEHQMPGMLSADQMRALETTRGEPFERLFLDLMIQHHRGALIMVQQLLARPGGAQDPETFRFASDVDADQRAEIARMERMLAARGSPKSGR